MGRIKAGEHAYDDRVSRGKSRLIFPRLNVKRLVNYYYTKKGKGQLNMRRVTTLLASEIVME